MTTIQISEDALAELWARAVDKPVASIDRDYMKNLVWYLDQAVKENNDHKIEDFLNRPYLDDAGRMNAYVGQMMNLYGSASQ